MHPSKTVNIATKTDVVGIVDIYFRKKEEEFFRKQNSPFYITVAIVCGILVVIIQFLPDILINTFLGKAFGVGSLSAIVLFSLKNVVKVALEKLTFIGDFAKKIIRNVFKRRKKWQHKMKNF